MHFDARSGSRSLGNKRPEARNAIPCGSHRFLNMVGQHSDACLWSPTPNVRKTGFESSTHGRLLRQR